VAIITGAEILTIAGVTAPTAEDQAWADLCAAATDDAAATFLDWPDPIIDTGEIKPLCLLAGAELYVRRAAPFGQTGYVDLNTGGMVRMARDFLEGVKPALARHRNVAGLIA